MAGVDNLIMNTAGYEFSSKYPSEVKRKSQDLGFAYSIVTSHCLFIYFFLFTSLACSKNRAKRANRGDRRGVRESRADRGEGR